MYLGDYKMTKISRVTDNYSNDMASKRKNTSKSQNSDSLLWGIFGGSAGLITGGILSVNLEVSAWSKAVDKGIIDPWTMANSNRVKMVNWERKNFPKMKELLMKGKLALPIILSTTALFGITAATVYQLSQKMKTHRLDETQQNTKTN